MTKVASIVTLLFAIVLAITLWALLPERKQKVEQVDDALSTLGNFAENRVKTSDDVKIFNDLLKVEPQKEKAH